MRRDKSRKQRHLAIATEQDTTEFTALIAAALSMREHGVPMAKIGSILRMSRSSVYRLITVKERLIAFINDIDSCSKRFDLDRTLRVHDVRRKMTRQKRTR
jgi:hypothetical protein